MTAYIRTLKDKNGDQIIPKTKVSAVEDANSVSLESILSNKLDKEIIVIAKNLTVPVSAWTVDSTYISYGYRAAVAINGITSSFVVDVYLDMDESKSGIFAPINNSYNGGVYIYASAIPESSIIIPTIKGVKEVV